MSELLASLKTKYPKHIGEIRQLGFMAGIDLMANAATDEAFPWQQLTGVKVCTAARKHGLLTRPVRDTIVLMPPLSISHEELEMAVSAISEAIEEVC